MTHFEFESYLEAMGYLRKDVENTGYFCHRTWFISNFHKDLPNVLVEEVMDYENPYYKFTIRLNWDNHIVVSNKFSDVMGYLNILLLVHRDFEVKYTLKEGKK